MTAYIRPLVQNGSVRPDGAVSLAGSDLWFTHAEAFARGAPSRIVDVDQIDPAMLERLSTPRADICGLSLSHTRIMGILNVTPDSFSDGGDYDDLSRGTDAALTMAAAGADIIDVGGESTRPGADYIPPEQEIARTAPVIAAIREQASCPISIDTRKSEVAAAALDAGADLVNDVSGLQFDAKMASLCADRGTPICVMHSQGDPATMQDNPTYTSVVLDVYDFLAEQVARLEALGLNRAQIVVDPGIGFGKTQNHNLALLQNLSLFHGLGCAILLGVSRKRFIGDIGLAPVARDRAFGSVAVGLAGLAQGVQLLRVHDVAETVQALRLWQAVR